MQLRNKKKYSYSDKSTVRKIRKVRKPFTKQMLTLESGKNNKKDVQPKLSKENLEKDCIIFKPMTYPISSTPKRDGKNGKEFENSNLVKSTFDLDLAEQNMKVSKNIDISDHKPENNYEISLFSKSALNDTDKFDNLESLFRRQRKNKNVPKWSSQIIKVIYTETQKTDAETNNLIPKYLDERKAGIQNYLSLLKKFKLYKNF
ncbi:hypothetical protein SNEBB_005964 [Seison nebaliae]|nr:hypothetical protein SNEBB_005964 [Seison nebaliae]